jgi:predicted NUDIX family NTP pyrophosphohydrolase
MPKIAAGLVMYRRRDGEVQVLLAHPGGPLWAHKDEGVWTIPKGEPTEGEELLGAAQREFAEETGIAARGPFMSLGWIVQKGGKTVHAWAFEGDCDPTAVRSNHFRMEWPPKSGRWQEFVEIDRADFFPIEAARRKLRAEQAPLLDALLRQLGRSQRHDAETGPDNSA